MDDDVADDTDEDELDRGHARMVKTSALSIILEWACQVLDARFVDVRQLAKHLVVNNYVDSMSPEAITVRLSSTQIDLAWPTCASVLSKSKLANLNNTNVQWRN